MPIEADRLAVNVSGSGFGGVRSGLDSIGDSALSARGAVSKLGKVASAASAALGALAVSGFGQAVQAAADFETAMVEVEKVTNPETARQMSDAVRDMARTIPLAQKELAGIAADAARFGVRGPKNIRAFSESVAKMATATNLSANRAGKALAKLGELTNTPVRSIENLGSSINELSNNFATSSKEIVDSMLRSSASLSQLGLEQTEIAGLSAALNEVSESSRRAGTRLRRLSQEMVDPKKVGDLASAFGKTEKEFRAMVKSDPTSVIRQMAKAMASGGKRADALRSALSVTSEQALAGLGQNLKGVNRALGQSATAFKENTSLQSEFNTATDTFNAQLKRVWNRLRNVAITLGNALLPALTGLLKRIQPVITRAQEFAKGLSDVQIQAAAIQSAVMAVGGAIGYFVPQLRVAIAVVQGLTAVFLTHRKKIMSTLLPVYQEIRDQVSGIGAAARELQQSIRVAFAPIFAAFRSLEDSANRASSSIVSTLQTGLIAGIRDAGRTIRSALQSITVWFEANTGRIQRSIRQTISTIGAIAQNLQNIIQVAFEPIFEAFRSLKKAVNRAVSSIVSTLQTGLIAGIKNAKRIVQSTLRSISSWFESNSGRIQRSIRQAMSTVVSTTKEKMSAFENTVIRPALSRVEALWSKHGAEVKQKVRQAFQFVKNNPKKSLQTLLNRVTPLLGLLVTAVRKNLDQIKSEFFKTFDAIKLTVWTSLQTIKRQIIDPLRNSESQTRKTLTSMKIEFQQTFSMLAEIVTRFTSMILGEIGPFLREMLRIWRIHFSGPNGIVANTRTAFNALWGNVIKPMLDTIQTAWNLFGDDMVQIMRATLDTILTVVKIGFDAVLTAINVVLDLISGDFEGAWNHIKGFTKRTIRTVATWIQTSGKALIGGAISVVITAIKYPFEQLYNWLIGGSFIPKLIGDVASWLRGSGKKAVKGAFGAVISGAESAVGSIDLSPVEDAVNDIITEANDAISALNDIPSNVTTTITREINKITNSGSGGGVSGAGGSGGNPEPGPGRGGQRFRDRSSGATSGREEMNQKYQNMMPKMASGGIVSSATPAIVGEAGPEAIAPLDQLPSLLASAAAEADSGGGDDSREIVLKNNTIHASSYAGGRAAMDGMLDEADALLQ